METPDNLEFEYGSLTTIERLTLNKLGFRTSIDGKKLIDQTLAVKKLIRDHNRNKVKSLPDYLPEYLNSNLVITKSHRNRIKTKDLYEHYISFAEEEGRPHISKQQLTKALFLNGVYRVNVGKNLKAYNGVRFKTNEDKEWEL